MKRLRRILRLVRKYAGAAYVVYKIAKAVFETVNEAFFYPWRQHTIMSSATN